MWIPFVFLCRSSKVPGPVSGGGGRGSCGGVVTPVPVGPADTEPVEGGGGAASGGAGAPPGPAHITFPII